MLSSFEPIIDNKTHTLIIGTMPGVASLAAKEYYANPHNMLWKIISELFNDGKTFDNYDDKKNCLLRNGIGLWDSLQNCSREGSLDINIKDAVPNDFEALLAQHSHVKKLLFNGKKAYEFFKRFHSGILENLSYLIMPSTSPANASVPLQIKSEQWKNALRSHNKLIVDSN